MDHTPASQVSAHEDYLRHAVQISDAIVGDIYPEQRGAWLAGADAIALLRKLEWAGTVDTGRFVAGCPCCGALEPGGYLSSPSDLGHDADCELKRLIS